MSTIHQCIIRTPIGALRLLANPRALIGVYFPDHAVASPGPAQTWCDHPILVRAADELHEYFAGRRRRFDVPIELSGTRFQRDVLMALRGIELGQTRSYAELARGLGRPQAARAIGAANARNPLSLVLPCHRVIGSNGALTGYAGGLARKQWLLAHERRLVEHHAA